MKKLWNKLIKILSSIKIEIDDTEEYCTFPEELSCPFIGDCKNCSYFKVVHKN